MFDYTSRYYATPRATHTTARGRELAYVTRRFLPRGASLPLLAELTVRQGERLDLVAHRSLGDPLQFWRIADANDAVDPFDLVAPEGRALRIPVPKP